MEIISEAVKKNTLKAVKRAAVAADQTLVIKTPVDTGRARGNWVVSIGAPSEEQVTKPDEEGYEGAADEALTQGRTTISGYKLGGGGIFITNNVPYIVLLDTGSSAKAPNGMTADAILAAEKQFGDARLLEGI